MSAPANGENRSKTPTERDRRDYRRAVAQHDAAQRSGWDSYRTARVIISGPPGSRRRTTVEVGAIKAASDGDVSRLVDLLRARRPPVDEDFDGLADYVEAMAKRAPGRERNEAVHEAARLADILMHMDLKKASKEQPTGEAAPTAWAYPDTRRVVSGKRRSDAIRRACEQIARERGVIVKPKQVRDLLSRPKKRRQPRHRKTASNSRFEA